MVLKIVHPAPPTPNEEVVQRVKRMERPDGIIQCNRCGGRTMLTTTAGAIIKKGRKQGGTVIAKDVCADCWKRGVSVPMLPELAPVK